MDSLLSLLLRHYRELRSRPYITARHALAATIPLRHRIEVLNLG